MEAEAAEAAESRRPLLILLTLLLVTIALAFAPAGAQAQAQAQALASPDVVLVTYHVTPDPRAGTADADPFSTSAALPDAPFAGGALPATRVDGVLTASNAPEGDPSNPAAHTRELQRLLAQRAATGAPLALELRAGATSIDVRITPLANLTTVLVHAVIVKDGAVAKSRVERALAVAALAPRALDLSSGAPQSVEWDRDAANADGGTGVVAWVEIRADAGTHRAGEVVQAVRWSGGDAAANRGTKAVLVEHLTATWCEPCAPSDAAVALVAGAPGASSRPSSYLVAPTAWTLAGLAAGAVAAGALLRRRAA